MAAIIRDDKQDNALAEIESALSTVRSLNLILRNRNSTAAFQVGMVPEKGRGVRIDVGKPEKKIFIALCTKYRTRLVKEIRVKAEKFRISLDGDDTACMEEADGLESWPETGDSDSQDENEEPESSEPDTG